jgi:hypothetical protein
MSIATSSTLTQEFVQMLSAELLYAPDSAWIFAGLAAAERDAAFAIPDMMAANGAGGFGAAMGASARPGDRSEMGRGFCKVVQGPGTPGLVALIDRPIFPAADFGEAARRLTEGTPIDTSNLLAPSMGQATLTMHEYAGPMKADGSAVAPFAITSVLKQRAKHDLVQYLGELLRRDRNAFVDGVIRDLFLGTSHTTTPAGVATGTMTAGGSPLSEATLAQVLLNLQRRNIRPFPNGNFMLVLDPQHFKDLRGDSAFREITRYQVDRGPVLSGYLASYGGFDFCTSTNMKTAAVGSGGAVTGYQALAFGPEALGWAIGADAHAERSKNDDFNRQDLVIWNSIESFALLNDAIVERIVTS